jgi:type 1 glutamine amidotransferase
MRNTFRSLAALALGMTLAVSLPAQQKKKRVLAIGAVAGYQHDSVSQGLGTIWKIGQESGLYDTFIRTDTQLITKKKLPNNAKNLDYFDAVFFNSTGDLGLDDEQKAALLSFIRDDGKAFLGAHTATDCNYTWPAYGEMVGGYFDLHPWGVFPAPVILEDRDFPATRHFPAAFTITDEIYQIKEFSRDRVRVLMRLDDSKLDYAKPNIHRADKDFAITWVRNYGKGRVFHCGFGHTDAVWNQPDIQKMWLEAFKWALGLTPGDATPRPRPGQ